MHRLQRPIAIEQAVMEPIEQIGMGGLFAEQAKVVDCADEP